MGKQRRQRKKYHHSKQLPKEAPGPGAEVTAEPDVETQPLLLSPTPNLFTGLDINIDNLKKLSDNCSLKSFKSEASNRLPKKDKVKLRRKFLMEKLDATVKAKPKLKKKKLSTNPTDEALPSLKSLLEEKVETMFKKPKSIPKRKGTPKASKRKRYFLNNVNVFKKLMDNSDFKTNPLKIVSEHIAHVVERSKRCK